MISSVALLLFNKMKAYGILPAIKCKERLISYGELSEKALTIAGALIECGAKHETIGIVGQRTPSSYIGILGILYAGCNYVPINPKYNEQKLISILIDANVKYLVGDKSSLEKLEPVLAKQNLLSIQAVLLPEGICPAGKRWIDDSVLKKTTPLGAPIATVEEDLAYILFTSGSTGKPKGVQVSNSNVLAFLESMASIYQLEVGFRASQTFDFSFDPSVSDMFFTWANGGTLCVLPEEELMMPHEYIIRERITFWNSVPAIASFLYKMGYLRSGIFPELNHSMFCGEQFPKYLADAWRQAAPNSTVENLYGPTEATIYISRYCYPLLEASKNFRNSIIPIGRPFIKHEFALIDEDDKLCPQGGTGEIVFKGPQISKGYLNDPDKTKNSFVKFDWDETDETWYKSGDIGFYNVEDNLECIGRKDSQIKLGGRRIEIGEIEATLARYSEAVGSVVVPVRDANGLISSCVAFMTTILDKERQLFIRGDSEKYLERIFFPKKFIYIKEFPLSLSGKVDRKALELLATIEIYG